MVLDVATAFSRAYPAQANRQQSHDRLVHTAGELVTVLGLALNAGPNAPSVATIRLGADIAMTGPIVLNGTYNAVIDGGGQYRFVASPSYAGTELFQVPDGGLAALLLFRDVGFNGPVAKLERLISLESTAQSLNFERVKLRAIKAIHGGSGTSLYQDASFVDVSMSGLALTDTTLIGPAEYQRCIFQRCYAHLPSATIRLIDIGDTAGSSRLVVIEAGATLSTSAVRLLDFDESQIFRLNVVRMLTVGEVVYTPGSVTLNAANPILSPGNASYVRITILAGATGNITLDVSAAVVGQVLVLHCIANAGTAVLPDNIANNVRLTAVWNPIGGQTLTLIFDGTFWVETARANN